MPLLFKVIGEFLSDFGCLHRAKYTPASISIFACGRRGCPLRRYARLVGAPNCTPSLRSVAGLLLALALQSACEDTLTSRHSLVTARGSKAIPARCSLTDTPSFARRATAR